MKLFKPIIPEFKENSTSKRLCVNMEFDINKRVSQYGIRHQQAFESIWNSTSTRVSVNMEFDINKSMCQYGIRHQQECESIWNSTSTRVCWREQDRTEPGDNEVGDDIVSVFQKD
ncbi:hypothetical protein CHS0354_006704 [Potamilus streckersoni]|uniref:Uncharacterized protein n=1 Tax=Potamilus streckersoni TaxID=2493646 RepID=A0AAE0RR75_9BIVA|nr:hypothetical protein CHS0354_006704 [Potamilus streckersoni]